MENVAQIELEDAPTPRPYVALTSHAESTSVHNDSSFSITNATGVNMYYFFQEVQFTLLGVLLVAIIVGNASVIVALQYTKSRKSRMNFFIMQLAIADLFVGLIFVTSDIIQKVTISWYAGEIFCKLFKFLTGVVMYASSFVLVALSIDRCDAITNPMNFSGGWIRARALVVCSWLMSVVCSIPLLVLPEIREIEGHTQCWIDLGPVGWKVWITSVAVIILILPTITIAACYTIIVLTIWTKSKAVVMSPNVASSRKKRMFKNDKIDGELESRRASSRGLIPRAKIKSVKMSLVIVFVFILCWSPYFVFDLLQVYKIFDKSQNMIAWATLIQSLAPLNSAANPIICCLFSPHICSGLRRLPPYRWLCRARRAPPSGSESTTAHSDLFSSTRVKTSHSGTMHGPSILNTQRRNSNTHRNGDTRSVTMQLTMNPRE